MNFLKNYKLIIGTALGASAGYAYYYFVGCANGTCPITSNPIISTFYGAMIGGIMFVPNIKLNAKKDDTNEEKQV